MFALKVFGVFVCAIAICESKFVETLSKCSINDGKCQAALVTSSLQTIHKTGVPELGIPSIDPYPFKDVSVSILDLLELRAIEGVAKGIKDCVVDSMTTDIEQGHTEMTMTCNSLNIKAKYKLSGSSPFLKNLFGSESIHGEGNGKVKIEKIQIRFNYFYKIGRNQNGEPFFNCKFNKTIYDYEILGKVSFAADNIYMGDQDISQLVIGFLNENGKFVLKTFGKPFMDKAMEFVYVNSHKFFNVVPAKHYIIEDLSPYVNE